MEGRAVSPIALFAFRRPRHLARTLHALARNPQAMETEIYAFVDASKKSSDAPCIDDVCATLEKFATSDAFKRVEVLRAAEPKGLARSVIEGLSLVLRDHDRVIGLEDDIVLAPTALGFLNGALDAYERDRDVWSVSAFAPPLKMPAGYDQSIYFTRRASSWGYATWKDRWEEMTWDSAYFESLASSPQFRRRFALGGNDLPPMLDNQLAGLIDSWAVRWCARQAELGALTVYPTHSLVLNTGLDGSGTHSPVVEGSAGSLGSWEPAGGGFGEARLNSQISKRFGNYYVSRRRLLASKVWGQRRVVFRWASGVKRFFIPEGG